MSTDFDKMMKVHNSPSFLVKFLVMILDRETKKELHSEEVAVTFYNREHKYLRGQGYTYHYDHGDMGYYIRLNTVNQVEREKKPNKDIFFTNQQLKRFEELCEKIHNHGTGKTVYDSCHLETITGDEEEIKNLVRDLRNDKNSVVWLGEFV